ncbi:exo-beta-N-acetylmuramidase NamZ domain-containing protein [Armatimonas sp.]|uniref:exo-beta-N-acetylmuramidase NamZ family protein n=1 Tax=Armatimonas sp. TaxID=1872638 RepID=UPI003750C0D0
METASSSVLCGVDVLVREKFSALGRGPVGLITNHTGLTRDGVATADVLAESAIVPLKAFFGPEHGIRGAVDEKVPDGKDPKTGLPVYSLYGERYEPTAEQLAGIETLVYDIQDVGCRFYTFLSTLGHCLTAAAKQGKRFVVLDRPNPIGGVAMEGPIADKDKLAFVAYHPIPVRHGMTMGELAKLIVTEKGLKLDLTVIPCEGWKRGDYWDVTGLTWTNPSPNMRSLTQATLYPGVGLIEFTNISVGRGTDTPFEWIGAPYLDPRRLAASLNETNLPGIRFIPVHFTPRASKFVGERCGGVSFLVTDRQKLTPVRIGVDLALTLRKLYPKEWQAERMMTLLVNRQAMDGILAGDDYATLSRRWSAGLRAFANRRKPHLLYP